MKWQSIKNFKSKSYQASQQNFNLFDKWAENKGELIWSSRYNIDILNKEIKKGEKLNSLPPLRDHVQIFKALESGKIFFVYHSYFPFEDLLDKVAEWKINNAQDITVYEKGDSWYNPNACMVILVFN